ncbi:MAG: hypothetical protein A3K30_03905 [Deltaproteobacteria bacterium RBG_13_51_10]|nr:MAG: hypothetical protein A3K30_03905 [Deltaproteobacteria bacterium RBG_13_51_10]
MKKPPNIWEFEGDWYVQPPVGLAICMNTQKAAVMFYELLSGASKSSKAADDSVAEAKTVIGGSRDG